MPIGFVEDSEPSDRLRMPFLSKDWRSPGEKWVRYGGGWEMRKTVWATHRYGTGELHASCFIRATVKKESCRPQK